MTERCKTTVPVLKEMIDIAIVAYHLVELD